MRAASRCCPPSADTRVAGPRVLADVSEPPLVCNALPRCCGLQTSCTCHTSPRCHTSCTTLLCVDLGAFEPQAPGRLVRITGTDPSHGPWEHAAFVPDPLPRTSPDLSARTYRAVADARAALAALDSTARRLPNPRIFRRPALQAEAQSTSALEGTYAPLIEVLTADEERPPNLDLREVLNYVRMGDTAFGLIESGQQLTVSMLEQLQGILMRGTRSEGGNSGALRDHQVVVGQREGAHPTAPRIHSARFVPSPPGLDLRASLQDLLDWMVDTEIAHEIDPVVAAALAHYQFETLHPFHDGNGRIGRFIIVVHLLGQQVLLEPTLTVSPWFEARRSEYYDQLLAVSTRGDWDSYIRFFATGLGSSADTTHERMLALVEVQKSFKERIRRSTLRADTAHTLADYAIANTTFTVRAVESYLSISYGRANSLVNQLVQLGILAPLDSVGALNRRFYAPEVLDVVIG
ncbi:Fic/DOC family N-terminal domain-containing protein [Dactylosporangium sp. NPDC006015]|uniref:Fic family protein n=1 Tax=Dactylosporangium sp. NPDC006015 TaxID=3154576 RepID=UPI0033B1BCFF